MKEAEESVGPPKREVKESRTPEIFSSYLTQVTSLREFESAIYEEASAH